MAQIIDDTSSILQVAAEIVTDVMNRSKGKAVLAKQNDCGSRFIDVRIQQCGKDVFVPNDNSVQVVLNVQRPDGTSAIFGNGNKVLDNGTVRVELNSWILEQLGTVSCDISLINEKESSKLTTMTFYVDVEASACDDSEIKGEPEPSLLVELLSMTQEAYDLAEGAANQATESANQAAESANQAAEAANQSSRAIQGCDEAAQLAKDAAAGVVTIEQNSQHPLTFWVGTQAEYDAIEKIQADCFYIITDDTMAEDIEAMIAEVVASEEKLTNEMANTQQKMLELKDDVDAINTNAQETNKKVENLIAASEGKTYRFTRHSISNKYTVLSKALKWAYIYELDGRSEVINGTIIEGEFGEYDIINGTIVDDKITHIVSRKVDGVTIDTYTVPQELLDIEGYGRSARSAYNTVDLAEKTFNRCVASIDMGELGTGWKQYSPSLFGITFNDGKAPDLNYKANILCGRYANKSGSYVTDISFELVDGGDGNPTDRYARCGGQKTFYSIGSLGHPPIVTVDDHGGNNKAFKILPRSNNAYGNRCYWDNVYLAAGRYIFSAWVKFPDATEKMTVKAAFDTTYPYQVPNKAFEIPAGKWQKITIETGLIPDGYYTMGICTDGKAAAQTFFVDDISVQYNVDNPNRIDKTIAYVNEGDKNTLYVYDTAYTTVKAFEDSLKGEPLYYELSQPEIIDISGILTDDSFIEVEGGGTVEVVSDDRIPYGAYMSIEYQVKIEV